MCDACARAGLSPGASRSATRPCSRSAIRSAGSSSPICSAHRRAAEIRPTAADAGDEPVVGSARLSKPPQDAPMPNSSSAVDHGDRSASVLNSGRNTTPNRLHGAGEIALPERVAGRAGQRRVQHLLHLRPRRRASAPREPGLHLLRPAARRACAARAAPASNRRDWRTGRAQRRCRAPAPNPSSLLVVTLPSSTSEWPPTYFVSAWIDTSTPCAERLEEMDAPGVVHQHLGAARMRDARRGRARPAPRRCGCRGSPV